MKVGDRFRFVEDVKHGVVLFEKNKEGIIEEVLENEILFSFTLIENCFGKWWYAPLDSKIEIMVKKLFELRPRKNLEDSPWEPWYDKNFGFVIRAESEERARRMAAEGACDEGKKAWLDSKFSSCKELLSDGDEEIVMVDFAIA